MGSFGYFASGAGCFKLKDFDRIKQDLKDQLLKAFLSTDFTDYTDLKKHFDLRCHTDSLCIDGD